MMRKLASRINMIYPPQKVARKKFDLAEDLANSIARGIVSRSQSGI